MQIANLALELAPVRVNLVAAGFVDNVIVHLLHTGAHFSLARPKGSERLAASLRGTRCSSRSCARTSAGIPRPA